MYVNKSIVVNSGNQNPNDFNVKLPYNMAIHPNTEVAVTSGKYYVNKTLAIDSCNDTFVLLWGNWNQNILHKRASNAGSECSYVYPEVFKFKHGNYNLFGNTSMNSIANPDSPNISMLLAKTLNEQTRYFQWRWYSSWSGAANSHSEIPDIVNYVPDYTVGSLTWLTPTFANGTPGTLTNNGTGAGTNVFTRGAGPPSVGSQFVSASCFPLPFDARYIVAQIKVCEYSLPAVAPQINVLFGGLIMEQQYNYRNNTIGGYDKEKDWILVGEDKDTSSYYNSQIPIGWEVDRDTGLISFHRRSISKDGKVGDIVETHTSAISYTGGNVIEIRLVPRLTNYAGGPLAQTDVSSFYIECQINEVAGGGEVVVGSFDLSDKPEYSKYKWRHALCSYCDQDITFQGLAKERFDLTTLTNRRIGFNDVAGGTAEDNKWCANLFTTLIPAELQVDSVVSSNLSVNTDLTFSVNSELADFTRVANCSKYITGPGTATNPDYRMYYSINAETASNGAAPPITAPVTLPIRDVQARQIDFHINIDNLPIENCYAYQDGGIESSRVHTEHTINANRSYGVIEPFNLIYNKIGGKSVQIVDNLKIRITDDNNATLQSLAGSLSLNLHFRTNQHAMFQPLIGAINNMAQKKETYDDYAQLNKVSKSVF